jgi:hypothetical protein
MQEEWKVGICYKQKAQHFLSDQTTTEITKKCRRTIRIVSGISGIYTGDNSEQGLLGYYAV